MFGLRMFDGEEVDVAPGGLVAGVGDQRRDQVAVRQRRGEGDRRRGDERGELVGRLIVGRVAGVGVVGIRLLPRDARLPGDARQAGRLLRCRTGW